MDTPADSREGSPRDRDDNLSVAIRGRIENAVEDAEVCGADAQRMTSMIMAAIEEFLPTRVQWASAYWLRVHNHTDRYLQVHPNVAEAHRRLDEIGRRELRPATESGATFVRAALMRRYRGEWTGNDEPNPLEDASTAEVVDAAQAILVKSDNSDNSTSWE